MKKLMILIVLSVLIFTSCTFSSTDLTLSSYTTLRPIKMYFYDVFDVLTGYVSYEYDNRNLIKESSYNESDVLTGYVSYEYDSNDNLIKMSYYDESDVLTEYAVCEWLEFIVDYYEI